MHKQFRSAAVAAVTVAAATLALAPSSAHAAFGVTLTDDSGVDQPWVGAPALRNMNPTTKITPTAGEEGYFTATIAGPDGAAATTPMTCRLGAVSRPIDYRGNGLYTLMVTSYAKSDRNCATPTGQQGYQMTINGSVSLSGPAGPVLMRLPGTVVTQPIALPFAGNPGMLGYEIRYAKDGAVGPDGALTTLSTETAVDTASGAVQFRPLQPGRYVFVARAKGFTTASGQFFSPWTPAVTVVAMAPFDIGRPLALDSRGPSYRLRFKINEPSASGRVNIAIGRGKKGKYKSYGSVKISSKATFIKRFKLRRSGSYRMRIRYKGNATTAGGTVVHKFRISRRYL